MILRYKSVIKILSYIWLCFLAVSIAEYSEYCNEPRSSKPVFSLSYDNKTNQVTAKWCTKANERDNLSFHLNVSNTTKSDCLLKKQKNADQFSLHSTFMDSIDLPLNCNYVCHWKNLNKVFTGCYEAWEEITNINRTFSRSPSQYQYVTSVEYEAVRDCNVTALSESNGKNLSVTWYMERAPVTNPVTLNIFPVNDSEFIVTTEEGCIVSENGTRVQCDVELPFGEYHCQLGLDEPWTMGSIFHDCGLYIYDQCKW